MKKYSMILGAALSIFALASCQKEVDNQTNGEKAINKPGSVPFELVANINEPVASKTTLNTDWSVDWEDGDIIYAVTTDQEWGVAYDKDNPETESIAEFTYNESTEKFATTKGISAGSHTFNFLYSNGQQKTYHRGNGTTFSLSGTQSFNASAPTANLKNYDALAAQLTATTPTTFANVEMSHLFTLMKVTLKNKTGDAITAKKFEIIANSGTNLYGVHTVSFGTTPSVELKSSGGSTLSVNISNGNIAKDGTLDVYFVMAPLSGYTGNITLKVTDNNDVVYSKTNAVSNLNLAAGTYNTANFSLKIAAPLYPTIDTSSSDYTTGFETGFTAESTYNNTTVKVDGPDGGEWGSYYGTASTNEKITGNNSMQMRWYTSATANIGYAESNFYLSNVGFVSFNAKQANGLKVGLYYKRASDEDWVLAQTFTPGTTSTKCSYSFVTPIENARIKFGIVLPTTAPSNTAKLWIDDVVVKANTPTYTIAIADGITNGTVSTDPSGSAQEGAEVTITATPDDGYALASLSVTDALSNDVAVSENKFMMPGSNVTVTATFTRLYTVTWNTPSNGTITVKNGTTTLSSGNTVPEGATISITVSPNDGYALSSLKYNDGSDHDIKNTKSFTMPAHDVSIAATFETASGTDVSVSIADYASANSWSNGTAYTTVIIDSNITATGASGGNNSKYYSSNESWRFYEGDSGSITITAATGTIKTITFTYTNGNSGVLKYGGVEKTSGTVVTVNSNTATFSVGHSSGTKNGNVQITAIAVSYE